MLILEPTSPDYPRALLRLPKPQPLTLSRALPPGAAVAIVGTRRPCEEARAFAFELGRAVAAQGGLVVSGGALGIDAAAHEGALAAGGVTLCVVGTGASHVFPAAHADLYRRIAASRGAMVWPFPADAPARSQHFLRRNGVLVGLAGALVVVQAGAGSGALNAAAWARKLGREVWVVPQAPWASRGFEGSLGELERGARPLASVGGFLRAALGPEVIPLPFPAPAPVGGGAPSVLARVAEAVTEQPRHLDELAEAAQLSITEVTTALLTLTLENVVEEGPLGFFSRAGK